MEIQIKNLSKTYQGNVKALDNVNMTIKQGMFGLLGPNGAGKTTLMRTIATLQEPDSGSIFMDELDVLNDKMAVRRVLGYLPQEFDVYPRVTALELLDHLAILKGITQKGERKEMIEVLLQKTNLYEHRKRKISTFSGGMKQRFGIAQALLGEPILIIVDEPTAGLDPGERNRFYNILSEIGQSIIVILSTHIVEDVKELCTNMAIIHQGKVVLQDQPRHALAELEGRIWRKSVAKSSLPEYQQNHTIISSKLVAGRPEIHVYSESAPDSSFTNVNVDLEDVFFTKIMQSAN
ncbi:MAG: ABC transporter ATP-binding protein [Calditrichaeota bacterium]|nr:ABC transporter ATP-binding protein [Calditrichota bacterium]